MQSRLFPFNQRASDHERLKEQFQQFCQACNNLLNDRDNSPYASFNKDAAELSAMDRTFKFQFHIIEDDQFRFGVIKILLPSDGDDRGKLLYRVYFDKRGNVKNTPDSPPNAYLINDTEFVILLLNDLSKRYLEHLNQTLDLPQ